MEALVAYFPIGTAHIRHSTASSETLTLLEIYRAGLEKSKILYEETPFWNWSFRKHGWKEAAVFLIRYLDLCWQNYLRSAEKMVHCLWSIRSVEDSTVKALVLIEPKPWPFFLDNTTYAFLWRYELLFQGFLSNASYFQSPKFQRSTNPKADVDVIW